MILKENSAKRLKINQLLKTPDDMPRHEKSDVTVTNTDMRRTQRKTQRISERLINSLDKPKTGNKITYDDRIYGFGVRVTPSGKKAFILNYRFKGRERRITIGQHPTWKTPAARKQAEELKHSIANGVDPLEKKHAEYSSPTVLEMWKRYQKDYLSKLSPRSQQDQASMFRKSVLPRLGSTKVSDVTFSDCEGLHRLLTQDRPIRANRVIEVLRRNFNLAIKWGWIERNPAVGIERNPEIKRERYLDRNEIDRLLKALENHRQKTSCDALKFILFTGCRRGEALNARWDQFDPDLKIWTKLAATTKQRRLHRVPVSSTVTKILLERRKLTNAEYVFASKNGNPLTDVKKTWAALTATAKIENARIHDLRHTFASIAVSQGQSLPIIGAMLGHTQTQTTARYAHLYDDPLIKAAEAVSHGLQS